MCSSHTIHIDKETEKSPICIQCDNKVKRMWNASLQSQGKTDSELNTTLQKDMLYFLLNQKQ